MKKQSLCWDAVTRALSEPHNHSVDFKDLIQKNGKCEIMVLPVYTGTTDIKAAEEWHAMAFGDAQTRAARIIADDKIADNVNKGEIVNVAKMYTMYARNKQNGTQYTPEQLLFNDVDISKEEVDAASTAINNGMAQGHAPEDDLASFRDYYIGALNDLKLEDVVGLGEVDDVRNSPLIANKISSTLSYLNKFDKSGALAPADRQKQGVLANMTAIADMVKDLNSPDPNKALAATVVYNMFAPKFQGKTLGEIAEMYPANGAGQTYFTYIIKEGVKRALGDDATADELKSYRETGMSNNDDRNRLYRRDACYLNIKVYTERFTEINGDKIIKDGNVPDVFLFKDNEFPDYQKAAKVIAENAASKLNISKEAADEFTKTAENVICWQLIESDYVKKCEDVRYKDDLKNDMNEFIKGSNSLPYFFDEKIVSDSLNIAAQKVNSKYGTEIYSFDFPDYSKNAVKPPLIKNSDYYAQKDMEKAFEQDMKNHKDYLNKMKTFRNNEKKQQEKTAKDAANSSKEVHKIVVDAHLHEEAVMQEFAYLPVQQSSAAQNQAPEAAPEVAPEAAPVVQSQASEIEPEVAPEAQNNGQKVQMSVDLGDKKQTNLSPAPESKPDKQIQKTQQPQQPTPKN